MRRPWLWGLLLALVIAVMVVTDLRYHWSSFFWYTVPLPAEKLVEGQKSIWDWFELLIVPLAIALSALLFGSMERENERNIAEKRRIEEREIAERQLAEDRRLADERIYQERVRANERVHQERQIADENAQEAALQAYFEQMSMLLIDKNLRQSTVWGEVRPVGDEVRSVARAWTLTVLRRVKDHRKGVVIRFLQESHLIDRGKVIIALDGADLRGADLNQVYLTGVDLAGANLAEADLRLASLTRTDLQGADLSEADLQFTDLRAADLRHANLSRADLRHADLSEADLRSADLNGAKYDMNTEWTEDFNPTNAGAQLISEA